MVGWGRDESRLVSPSENSTTIGEGQLTDPPTGCQRPMYVTKVVSH